MRLVEAKDDWFLFHVTKRERALLTQVLKQFPVGSGPRGPLSKSGDPAKLADNEAFLAVALAEQRAEHRRQLDMFLGEQGRFADDPKGGYRVRFTNTQMDWLLRVLNEIRVGLWQKLGQPRDLAPLALAGQLDAVVTMELCALFQTRLLAALNGEGPQ